MKGIEEDYDEARPRRPNGDGHIGWRLSSFFRLGPRKVVNGDDQLDASHRKISKYLEEGRANGCQYRSSSDDKNVSRDSHDNLITTTSQRKTASEELSITTKVHDSISTEFVPEALFNEQHKGQKTPQVLASTISPHRSQRIRIDCPNMKNLGASARRRSSFCNQNDHQQHNLSILDLVELDELDLSREQKMVLESFSSRGWSNRLHLSDSFRPRISIQEPDDDQGGQSSSGNDDEKVLLRQRSLSSLRSWNADRDATSYRRDSVVRFSTVTIRDYPVAIGDNPSVLRGVPLTIEWNQDREYNLSVDNFESVRQYSRRTLGELQMRPLDRIRLLRRMGYSRQDLKTHQEMVDLARSARHQTRVWGQYQWWTRLEEGWEQAVRAIRNKTTRRRYKQWERDWLAKYCNAATI